MKPIASMGAAAAFVALVLHGCGDDAPAPVLPNPPPPVVPVTSKQALRDDMREVWTAHVTWTRGYVMSAIAGLPDQPTAAARLLKNQEDIGKAIEPFYGAAAGDQLTALLKEHITGAVAVLDAAEAGDTAALDTATAAWRDNADRIARFLADANPNLPFATLQQMMRMHLDQTIAEATARLSGDWAGDVAAYDAIVHHILTMADALTDGIAAQFPELVTTENIDPSDEALHLAMRELWQDHVTWTRVFLISTVANLPDQDAATARLLKNQEDIGNAIRPLYGDAAADQLIALLKEHIMGAAEVVGAAIAGDQARLDTAMTAWRTNADQIADFLAAANPSWSREHLRGHMRAHLDATTAEATARIQGDWDADVAAYDDVVQQILQMSDVLADGLMQQFP